MFGASASISKAAGLSCCWSAAGTLSSTLSGARRLRAARRALTPASEGYQTVPKEHRTTPDEGAVGRSCEEGAEGRGHHGRLEVSDKMVTEESIGEIPGPSFNRSIGSTGSTGSTGSRH